MQHNTVLFCF